MKREEIHSLTGLRAVAALCVVVGHYAYWTTVINHEAIPQWFWSWIGPFAGIGMSIFFTLSGFVIALSYSHWDWRDRPAFNMTRLFFYRLARLYPAFLLFAIVAYLRGLPLRDLGADEVVAYVLPHLALMQSWLPAKFAGALVADDAFHVSWSLSTECALYVMFGLCAIAMAALPARRRMVVAVLLFAATAVLLWQAWSQRAVLMPTGWTDGEWYRWLFAFSPWGVALQFGAGVLAYRISAMELPAVCYRLANHAGALGLLGVYVAGATGVVTQHVPQAIVSGASTALLMIGATSPTATNRLLAHPVLLHIGMVSYSLYLFHFVAPALGFSGKLPTVTEASVLFSIINFVLCTFMAVMLATGIYYLVEVPGRRAIRRVGDEWLGVQRAPKPEVLTKLPLES